ncbi:hypothetical protein Hypma_013732 [Hypsizygus marmoreus]|uniref:Uncharacterized protein n=1 Tax=Hypsizygus marmoreus TaxID=39966 RepID=A0A369JAS6_HYPMA|nr:hypothetical protein Hypma_013732 [Hypsizygus marmoreus]
MVRLSSSLSRSHGGVVASLFIWPEQATMIGRDVFSWIENHPHWPCTTPQSLLPQARTISASLSTTNGAWLTTSPPPSTTKAPLPTTSPFPSTTLLPTHQHHHHHHHHHSHHQPIWTNVLPPELIEAAREEEAYLTTSAGQLDTSTRSTIVSGFVPVLNILPAPGLPCHLDKLILNACIITGGAGRAVGGSGSTKGAGGSGGGGGGPGGDVNGGGGRSGRDGSVGGRLGPGVNNNSVTGRSKGRERERERRERERDHDDRDRDRERRRDRRVPPLPPPPSEAGVRVHICQLTSLCAATCEPI